MPPGSASAALLALFVCCSCTFHSASGIDCFKCVSVNGDNPACDDPFHNNYTAALLHSPCMGGRKHRNGVFPASACIKLAGVYADTKQSVTIRGCALDSGTLTTDTEIIRMSHCGWLVFDDRYVHGCLQSCDDADACNGAQGPRAPSPCCSALWVLFFLLVMATSSSLGS